MSANSLNKTITCAKIVGLGFLVWSVCANGFHFNYLMLLLYLGIVGSFAGVWLIGEFLYEKVSRRDDSMPMSQQEIRAMETLLEICREVGKKPWMVLLIPGEDGLFFLPLLYLGVNPVSALAASALFGAAHLVCKPVFACIGTAIISYFLCLFVLPYGIGAMVVGHLIVDLSVFAMTPYLKKKLEKEREKLSKRERENESRESEFFDDDEFYESAADDEWDASEDEFFPDEENSANV